jgi:hypothetical protein
MHPDAAHHPSNDLSRIIGHVSLVADSGQNSDVRVATPADSPQWLKMRQRDDLSLSVTLSAEDQHGRLIAATTSFGIAGPSIGAGAAWCRVHPACSRRFAPYRVCALDILESIDQMLGRDPALRLPPRLAWDGLLAALKAAEFPVTTEQLKAIPLTLILGDDVDAELRRVQNQVS